MAESILIRLTPNGPHEAEWLQQDNATGFQQRVSEGSLAAAVQHVGQLPVTLIVPGEEVVMDRVRLPMRGAAKMQQAVPFALEEQLADDVGDMHFAVGKRDDDGKVKVAFCRRELLQGWIDAASSLGLKLKRVVADTDCIPTAVDQLTIMVDGDRSLLCTVDGERSILDTDALADSLQVLGYAGESKINLTVWASDGDREDNAGEFAELEALGIDLDWQMLGQGPLPRLAEGALRPTSVNLLQGDFAGSSELSQLWRPWRTAAMLAAFCLAALLAGRAVELVRLKSQLNALNGEMAGVYRQVFGDAEAVPLDPRAVFASELRRKGAAVDGGEAVFMNMLVMLGKAAAANPGTTINELSYRRRSLDAKLQAPSVDTMDKIRQAAELDGQLEAEIKSTQPGPQGIEGHLALRKPEA